jgi:hypothetical protein
MNDEVGGRPVVVASRQPSTPMTYTRLADRNSYRFTRVDADRMRGARTTWTYARTARIWSSK